MQTQRVPVAPGVDLAVDRFLPVGPPARTEGTDPDRAGAPFVLVHGLASNARLWDGVADALAARGHAVATVDLRGHGRSSKPDGPYDMATVADDVATVVEALGFERPVVAGQSWGGNVVLELGARRPELVRGIACVDGGWLEPSRRFETWEACREQLAPPRFPGMRADHMEAHIRTRHPDWPDSGIAGVLANFEVHPDGTIAPWLTFDRHITVLRGLWDHHPSALYADLRVPVLLVPAEDRDGEPLWQKRDAVSAAESAIPRVRTRWFIGDHDIHAQFPDELGKVMSELTRDGFFA